MYKAVTFGVSGLYTGIAGALGATVVQFVLRIVSPFICRWLFWSAWS
jgi:ABC-type branched-subunit amino acid transport system permease subunit